MKNIEGQDTKTQTKSDEPRNSLTPDNTTPGDKESKEQTNAGDTDDKEPVLSDKSDEITSDMEMEHAGLDILPVNTSKQQGMVIVIISIFFYIRILLCILRL